MEKFEFKIKDKNGNWAKNGDKICVHLPENHYLDCNGPYVEDYDEKSGAEKIIHGILSMRLSVGFGVLIKEIEYVDDECDNKDNDDINLVGVKWIRIRTTKWGWWKDE